VLVMPFYSNGNLYEYLGCHPEAQRFQLLLQMAAGLRYLHSHSPVVVHGDIKPDNVLVNDAHEASLCDFGLSRNIHEGEAELLSSDQHGGGTGFVAAEVLNAKKGIEPKTTASDVYAFGGLILSASDPGLILSASDPFSSEGMNHSNGNQIH